MGIGRSITARKRSMRLTTSQGLRLRAVFVAIKHGLPYFIKGGRILTKNINNERMREIRYG